MVPIKKKHTNVTTANFFEKCLTYSCSKILAPCYVCLGAITDRQQLYTESCYSKGGMRQRKFYRKYPQKL